MKLFRRRKKVQNENWRIWNFFDEQDYFGLITYDVTYLEATERYDCKAEIVLDFLIPKNWMDEGLFPLPEGHGLLLEIEDQLISQLEKKRIDCMQVVRLTYDGKRTFIFEVNDLVAFLETMKSWAPTQTIEINIDKQAAWTSYKKWEPTNYDWQQIGNAQVIEQLIEHGSNPEMTHKLEFSFGGEPNRLEALRDELLKENGEFLLLEGDLLEIIFERELDDVEINPLTYFLMDKAEEFGCKFEGWRAPITN